MINYKELEICPNLDMKTAFLIRSFDIIVAGLGLMVLFPLFLIIGLAIKLTSPGPIAYAATRVGQNGHHFKLFKFRSMVATADRQGPGITVRDDPRITPLGRFLRRTKLDELPQLVNVLRGEMSLVGPRPEDPRYVAFYTQEQRQVLSVRPGITSVASLHYRAEESLLGEDWEPLYREKIMTHKLTLDLAYLQQRTIWTDLDIILRTIAAVFIKKPFQGLLSLRNRHIFALDLLILTVTPTLALALRLEGFGWFLDKREALIIYTSISLLVKLSIFYLFGLYRRYWRYAGIVDLGRVVIAVLLTTTLLTVLFISTHSSLDTYGLAMYRTVPLIDGLLTLLAVCGLRFGIRGFYHWQRRSQDTVGGRRTLIVGAGEAGTLVVREMRANSQLDMEPVAFVDDDLLKINTRVQGLLVLGFIAQIPKLVEKYRIHQIIVALPSASLGRQREIMDICRGTEVPTDNLPGVYELLAGSKTISLLPRFSLQRLLRRPSVEIDQREVATMLAGTTILVTGAGGSIGSELCRQIATFKPKAIVLLGRGENSIFEIMQDLDLSFPQLVTYPVIVDVRNRSHVDRVIKQYQPQAIFHTAAHKHVPFMEANVEEAIINNVLGTKNIVEASEAHNVKHLVLISSDKAVNPSSVMGATKRLAELLVIAAARRSGRTYMTVRFGNVLGSRGSVIPFFQRQIAAGGPITITHPEMCRYFMTIPEAVQLVLQATVLGRGGEVFVLDMGQPVRILDLATDLINLCGLKLDHDIKITFSGIRPGEKLNEELFLAGENYRRTSHAKIFVTGPETPTEARLLEQVVLEVIKLAQNVQKPEESEQLKNLLPQICNHIDNCRPLVQSGNYSQLPAFKSVSPVPPALSGAFTPTLRPRPMADQMGGKRNLKHG